MWIGDEPCEACNGGAIPCKGGGNPLCWRRSPEPQVLSAVLDSYGCVRTVVCTEESLWCHVGSGELAYTVPDLVLREPIAWNDIPLVIERARLELNKWLDTRPNLDAEMHDGAILYRLREKEQRIGKGSLDFNRIALT